MNSCYPTAFVWQLQPTKHFDSPVELKFSLDFHWEEGNQDGVYFASFKLEALKVRPGDNCKHLVHVTSVGGHISLFI